MTPPDEVKLLPEQEDLNMAIAIVEGSMDLVHACFPQDEAVEFEQAFSYLKKFSRKYFSTRATPPPPEPSDESLYAHKLRIKEAILTGINFAECYGIRHDTDETTINIYKKELKKLEEILEILGKI